MQPPTPARTLQGAEVGLEMLPLLSFLCPVSWPPLHPREAGLLISLPVSALRQGQRVLPGQRLLL